MLERNRRLHPAEDGPVAVSRDQAAEETIVSRRWQRPLDMLHADSLEVQILHRLGRCAGHRQERLLDYRRHHFDLSHVFARPGPIGQHAGRLIQIPFTRLVQHLPGVLQIAGFACRGNAAPPVALEVLGDRPLGRKQRQRLLGCVRLAQTPPRTFIVHKEHEFDIGNVLPGLDRMVHSKGDRVVPGRRLVLGGCGSLDPPPAGVPAARVRRSGTDRSLAVHEQLPEVPPAGFHVRQIDGPDFPLALLPSADLPPAAEHHLLSRRGGVGDRELLRAGILRPEGQRLRHRIRAAANLNDDLLGQSILDLPAHRVARPGQRGERRRRRAGVGIPPLRCDVEFGGVQRGQRREQQGGGKKKQLDLMA